MTTEDRAMYAIAAIVIFAVLVMVSDVVCMVTLDMRPAETNTASTNTNRHA